MRKILLGLWIGMGMIAGCGVAPDCEEPVVAAQSRDGVSSERDDTTKEQVLFSDIDHETRNECIHWCQFDVPECFTEICSGATLCTACCNEYCEGENSQGYSNIEECRDRCGGPSDGEGYGDECRAQTNHWTECASCCDQKMALSL